MNERDGDNSIIEYMLDLLRIEESGKFLLADLSDSERENLSVAFRIKNFIDEIPGGFLIYYADGDEKIVYANKALIKIFKCDSFADFKAHTHNSFKGIVHPDDLDGVEQSISKQIESSMDNLDYVEYRIIPKDGIVRWVEDYGHFVHRESAGDFYYVFISDATEKVTRRMVETATLINDRKEKEKQLLSLTEEYDKERKLIRQEHLRRLEVIEGLSVNYDSILYADLDNNKVLPYRLSVRLERQFEKKLQVRELAWFLDDYVKTWVHPDDRKYVAEQTSIEHIRKTLANSPTYYLNYRCIYKKETQYIQLRIVNVGGNDGVSQVVMGYRNVDEEVMREMKRKQILEVALNNAKIAEVAKNTFLSNMSHDMRTPLNAVYGYAALARKNIDDRTAVLDALDKIETASTCMLDLVEKVLEFTYLESKEHALDEEEFNVCELVNEEHATAVRMGESKRLTVELHSSVAHENVYGDKQKLQQILHNIINNAVKYTPAGGRIDISIDENKTETSEFSTYKFTVKDTGIGIDKDSIPRIFEPFERMYNTTHGGIYGAGLGLTITKNLVDHLGGEITCDSELDKGSTFTVALSLKIIKTDKQSQACDIDASDVKILVVEDNELNMEIETEILEEQGFTVDTAINGKIAVDKIASAKPDEYSLVLMDIQMPVMDGRTAAKAIRALDDPELANIPIIALSANAFESDKRASIEAGMNAHLTKPIDVPVLLDAIKSTLAEVKKNQ